MSCIYPWVPEDNSGVRGDLSTDVIVVTATPSPTSTATPTATATPTIDLPCILGMWQRTGSTGSIATYNFRRWKNGYYRRINSSRDKDVTGSWSIVNEKQIRLHEDGLYSMVFDLTCDGQSIWLRNTTAGSDNHAYKFNKM
jgi:hypothetical protein